AKGRGGGSGLAKDGGSGTAKDGGTSSPTAPISPATPTPAASPTPAVVLPSQPTVPWWPGCGGSSGQSSSPQSANLWSGYLNMLQQPHLAMPQQLGENSHFVGFANNWIPPSPVPAPYANGTPTQKERIDIDANDGAEASKSVKKRYWSHDEEVRLASAWLNISKDPVHGNCKKIDSFWGQ
ncbi:unnamed protein product, partial [Urochloa humidicola]